MKYSLTICARLGWAFLLAAFALTTILAGMASAGSTCCGGCCQPLGHHPAGMAKVKLLSAKSMNCCSGVAGPLCDLSAQSDARGRDLYRAIPFTPCGGSTSVAGGQTARLSADHIIIKNLQLLEASPESRPKYLEFQSMLI